MEYLASNTGEEKADRHKPGVKVKNIVQYTT